MNAVQADLFGTVAPTSSGSARHTPCEEVVTTVRERLRRVLALVQAAEEMPWSDPLAIIREDNSFRFSKDILPPAEGAALWAAFDVEMDRLYAVMNQGREPDPGE